MHYSDGEEIKAAVFQLGALKAPGPDGFPALFFHHYWKEVGGGGLLQRWSFISSGPALCSNN